MPSFVLNTVSTLSRVLNPGETGMIGQTGVLLTSGTAVRINGAGDLLNFGQLLSQGLNTVLVTAPGASVQNFGTLRNLLSGGTAINFATATAISANLDVLNAGSGVMTVTGAGSHILRSLSGGVTITNAGMMQALDGTGISITDQNDGDVGNHIVNSGTILTGTGSFNLAIGLQNDDEDLIENTGLIRGRIETGGGNDTIINAGHLSISDFDLGSGDDLLISTGLIDRVEVGPTVVGSLGDGNDTVDVSAGTGSMAVFGREGDDHYITSRSFALFINEFEGEGIDTLETDAANVNLGDNIENLILYGDGQNGRGNGLDNTITGSEISNTLVGQAGNDTISGGGGNDTIDGGSGNDEVGGGEGNDSLFGFDDDDLLVGGTGNDQVFGGSGNDTLDGFEDNDTVDGGLGDDTLLGGANNDTVISGEGNDRAFGGDGADSLTGDAGNDGLNGDGGNDTLFGGEGNDFLFGSQGFDSLDGGAGNDLLSGFSDNDSLFGGAGNDTVEGENGNDVLAGGAGADRLDGGAGLHDLASYADAATGLRADIFVTTFNTGIAVGDTYFGVEDLAGSSFNDLLLGDAAGNRIEGASGNDQVFGRTGNDTLLGGTNADTLFGNEGNDVLTGDSGADAFVFDAALGSGNVDVIQDFAAVDDIIHLNNAVFAGLLDGALSAAAFVVGTAATQVAHRVIYNTTNGQLSFDADGNGAGAAVVFATLSGAPTLTAADFLVI